LAPVAAGRWPAVELVHPWPILQLLILLMLANGTPVVAKKILGERFAYPLDGGVEFVDGQPLFGRSKTIRGVVLAVLGTMVGAPLIGLGWAIGFLVGSLAMAGDLASSFLKRRMALPPSSRASGLDQLPEALLPLLACRNLLSLRWRISAPGWPFSLSANYCFLASSMRFACAIGLISGPAPQVVHGIGPI
jgi:CDP-diglyceride synthetase